MEVCETRFLGAGRLESNRGRADEALAELREDVSYRLRLDLVRGTAAQETYQGRDSAAQGSRTLALADGLEVLGAGGLGRSWISTVSIVSLRVRHIAPLRFAQSTPTRPRTPAEQHWAPAPTVTPGQGS